MLYNSKIKSIYDLFDTYSEEEINITILTFKRELRALNNLEKAYGKDFRGTNASYLSYADTQSVEHVLIRFKTRLEVVRLMLNDTPREEIIRLFTTQSDTENIEMMSRIKKLYTSIIKPANEINTLDDIIKVYNVTLDELALVVDLINDIDQRIAFEYTYGINRAVMDKNKITRLLNISLSELEKLNKKTIKELPKLIEKAKEDIKLKEEKQEEIVEEVVIEFITDKDMFLKTFYEYFSEDKDECTEYIVDFYLNNNTSDILNKIYKEDKTLCDEIKITKEEYDEFISFKDSIKKYVEDKIDMFNIFTIKVNDLIIDSSYEEFLEVITNTEKELLKKLYPNDKLNLESGFTREDYAVIYNLIVEFNEFKKEQKQEEVKKEEVVKEVPVVEEITVQEEKQEEEIIPYEDLQEETLDDENVKDVILPDGTLDLSVFSDNLKFLTTNNIMDILFVVNPKVEDVLDVLAEEETEQEEKKKELNIDILNIIKNMLDKNYSFDDIMKYLNINLSNLLVYLIYLLEYVDNIENILEYILQNGKIGNTIDLLVMSNLYHDEYMLMNHLERKLLYLKLMQVSNEILTDEVIADILNIDVSDVSNYQIMTKNDSLNKLGGYFRVRK